MNAAELAVAEQVTPAEAVIVADRTNRKKWGIPFWVATAWLGVLALAAILAPVLPIRKTDDPDFRRETVREPGHSHAEPGGHGRIGHRYGGEIPARDRDHLRIRQAAIGRRPLYDRQDHDGIVTRRNRREGL